MADEDESEQHAKPGRADTDGDSVLDGDEDHDGDGRSNEDEDDVDADRCDGDRDGNEVDDEDEGDDFGTITSYDEESGVLVVAVRAGGTAAGTVTDGTEFEFADGSASGDPDGDDPDADDEGDEPGVDDEGDDEGEEEESDASSLAPGTHLAEFELGRGGVVTRITFGA